MYIKRCIYIIALLGLTACGGGGGGESTTEKSPVDSSPVVPVENIPETPSAQTFDLTGQAGLALAAPQKVAGTESESNSVVSTSFSNAIGTLRYASTSSNVEGNLTFGVTASDTDVMKKVSLYLPNAARSFVLCSDNCTPDFQATITGFNPQFADEVAGSLRIELIVEDSLGNSAVVDAFSVNWQPIQISALSASREGGTVNVSWTGNSSLERYNLYAATEVGITSENALDLENGIQKLAINGTTAEFNDVDESKNYHLLVTGIDNGGESGKSVPFSLAKLGGTANLPPVANNDNYQVNEDETITVNILDNDFDPEGLPLTVDSILLEPLNGTLTLDDSGSITYGARANFHGSDSASYRVIDAEGATAEATVFFEILSVNDNPIAVADTYGVDVSGNINAADTNLLSNDSDIDGDDLTVITTAITAPQLGSLSINADGSFSYQSTGLLTQNDQFVYQVTDGKGGTATATVTILPNGNVLPPIALNDNYTVNEDTTLVISSINLGILANDSDPNDLPFELQERLLIEPQHGQLNLALDGTFTYIPNSNFFGVDQFQYQIQNSADLVTQAFVTITINATADAPRALDDNYQTQEDIQLVVNAANGLLINDVDFDNSTLTVNTTPINQPQNGNLVLAEDGGFSYLPNQDFNGVDSFTYQVVSGSGLSNTANVNISVVPLNDVPVVNNDIATTNEDTQITVDVLANDTDTDGDILSLISVSLEHGTAVIVNEKITITPALNYFGEITATYTITDSVNAPETGTLVLTVLPVNDAPIALDDSYNLVEDAVLSILPSSSNRLLSNDSDVEGDTLTVTTSKLSDVTNGSLTLNSDGSFIYIPNANFNGTDSFVYQISDGNGGTAQARVILTVTALNDAPEITVNKVFTTLEDVNLTKLANDLDNLLSGASDADGDILAINTTPVSNVSNGSLTLNANGAFSYIPSANFNGTDSFSYQVIDGNGGSTQGNVTLRVTAVNDVPLLSGIKAFTTSEDGNLTKLASDLDNLLGGASDVDGDSLSINTTPVSNVSNGSLTLNANGAFSYIPSANFNGTDSFSYQVMDGNGGNTLGSVTLTVNAVNDLPIAVADTYSINEDTILNILVTDTNNLLNNDTDADGDSLTVSLVSTTTNGTLTLNNNGAFSYSPNANFNSTDSFTYRVSDGNGGTAQASVTLTVNAVNDVPVLSGIKAFTTSEDGNLTKLASDLDNLLSGASDADGDSLSINTTPVSNVSNGNLTLSANGAFSYTPSANFNGTDSFSYQVMDGNGGSTQGNVTLTVTAVNDVPLLSGIKAFATPEDNNLIKLASDSDSLLSGASDVDGDSLSINTTPVSNVSNGSLTLNANGAFSYIPSANFNGTDSFSYQVIDGNGGSTQGSVSLTVIAVNDLPVAVADVYSTNEDAVLNILVTDPNNLLNNDTDVDGDSLTVSLVSTTTNGTLTLNNNGAFSYSPDANFNSTDSFTYRVSDGNGGNAQASVTLTINAVNDAPVAVTDVYSVDEGTVLNVLVTDSNNPLNNDTDADGDSLTASLVSTTSNGTLILNGNGAFSYTPNLSFNGSDSFTYQVSDGNGGTAQTSVSITVIENNDPVAVDNSYSFNEDFTWVRLVTDGDQLLSNDTDVDGDVLTVNTSPISPVSNGTLTLNGNGSFTYVPEADFFGQDSFIYEISDGRGGTAQATVTLIVHAINDIPVIESNTKSFTFDEDTGVSKSAVDADNLLGGASDVDGDTLTVVLTSDDTLNGSLIFTADGSFSYSPDANFFGVETFSYRVTDNIIPSEVITVELNIQAVNDAPVSADAPYIFSITELASNGDAVGTINALDIEGDSIVYTLTSGDISLFEIDSSTGAITVKGTLPFDFETNQTHNLTATITDDGSPLIASANVDITINITDEAGDNSIEEVSDFGRTAFGGLELTGKKTQAQLTDSVRDGFKVYFVGSIDNVDKDIYMVAYNDDGTLDNGFGNNGTKTFDYGANEYAKAIVNIDNDYFVTFERNENNVTEVCFIKVDNSGDIDDSFGDNGLRCTDEQKTLTINDAVAYLIPATQGDDTTEIETIVAVGKVKDATDDDLLVIRVDKNGNFQTSTTIVSGVEVVYSPHIMLDITGNNLDDEGIAVYNPHNNEAMIAGNVLSADGDYDIFAWIFNPKNADGNYADFNNSTPKVYDVGSLGKDDKVKAIDGENTGSGGHTAHIVGSTVLASDEQDAFIIELDSTAQYVTSFGTNGIATYDVDGVFGSGISEFTGYVYNYEDDNLLLSGNVFDGSNYMPFATRIFLDGSVDTLNYGSNGYRLADYSGHNAYANSMSLDNDEGVWIAGYVEDGSDKDMAITVFDSSGDVLDDNDFDNGKNTLTHSSLYSDDSAAEILQIQSGAQAGKYLIASIADDGTNQHIILTRLTSTGQLDTTFDTDGNKQLKIGTSAKVNGMFELTSGNLIVYGDVTEEDSANGFIARIDQNGVLDVTFANNGIYKTTDISANNIHFNQAKQDALGNIIAVGSFESGSINAFVLRLSNTGALDTLFNSLATQGYVIGANTDNYTAVAIDSSNNIYAGGNRDLGDKDFLMVKYSVAGIQGVVASIDPNPGLDDSVEKLIFDSNNDLYWVGNEDSILPRVVIVKTNTSGALDTSFSGDGIGYFRMSSGLELTYAIVVSDAVIDSNDNIVVVGSSSINLAKRTKMLGRIKPDGNLDSDFDSIGYYRPSDCPNDANLESVVLLNNSSFVVAGQCYQNGNSLRNLHISHFTMN